MTEILKSSDKHFKATTITMLQRANTNTLETNLKIRSLKQDRKNVEEQNENFITENSHNNSNNQNTHLNGGA